MGNSKRFSLSEDAKTVCIYLALLAIVIIVFSQLHEGFLTINNIRNMQKHISITALAALGLTFVVAAGHYDMSFPWVGTLAGITTAFMISKDFGVVSSILGGLAAGAIFGFINGFAVGRYKMPDVILTIGTGSIAWGFAYIYSDGAYIYDNFLTSGILQLNDAKYWGFPFPVILMLAMYLIAYMFLHRSSHGRRFYATGDNKIGAVFSGVRINTYILASFVICSVMAGLATILIVANQGQGGGQSGLTILMPAYASVFLGISVFKRPTILGTFLGATLLAVMLNGFTLMSVPFYSSDLIISITLVFALGLSNETILRKLSGRKSTKGSTASSQATAGR